MACNGCKNNNEQTTEQPANQPATLNYSVVNVYPHDTASFVEGLEWHDSTLYESAGNYGHSRLIRSALKNGAIIKQVGLIKDFFGEGITMLNGKIYQLTYKEQKCFVYDATTFNKINEFTYDGEGWGMTNDGKHIIMDNGSDNLIFRDPETFKELKKVGVTDSYGPVGNINELEYANGFIYANIWLTNKIIKIDPNSGKVVAQADLTELIHQNLPNLSDDAVLNGIAYDSIGKRFFITGKLWPKLFEVKFDQ
jgi:glutamine cyclotransferase